MGIAAAPIPLASVDSRRGHLHGDRACDGHIGSGGGAPAEDAHSQFPPVLATNRQLNLTVLPLVT